MKELERTFLESYQVYSDEIFRYILFKLNNREKAKDTLQETFMRTWLYVSKGGKIENMKAFLYKTANNAIIDEYRKQNRRDNKVDSLDSMAEYGFEPEFDNIDSMIDNIDGGEAMKMIEGLPEIYSEVLFLRYSGNQTIPEIAEIMGQTDNTISVRLNRGIKKLKEIVMNKNEKK